MVVKEQQLERMRRIIGSEALGADDDELLLSYLDFAMGRMLNRRFPFTVSTEEMSNWQNRPDVQNLQVEIAVFLFNKRGAEGESLRSENGVSRSFAGFMDVPPELLQMITPRGRVVV